MRKQFIMLSFLGAFCVAESITVPAFADDVYVDLSVLRGLNDSNSVAEVSAPLFPEVKSSRAPAVETSFPTVSSKPTARKKTIQPQKAKPRKRVVKEDKSDKIVIPEKVVPVSGLKVSVPTVELKTVSENMEKDAAAPVAEIKKEPLPELKIEEAPTPTPDLSSEAAQVTAQPIVSRAFEAAKEKAENETSAQLGSAPHEPSNAEPEPLAEKTAATISEPNRENKPEVKEMVFVPQTSAPQPTKDNTAQSAAVSKTEQPQLLVPAPTQAMKANANEISFAPGADVLTMDNQQKIDTIIAGFENPSDNMIAIYAYNYDDGNDVFSKKRLSLRRIVAIRSYLLNKGYKNFMPKVINITDDNGKSDLVELEEIK